MRPPGRARSNVSSRTRARRKRLLDWEAEVSLEEGLRRTIEWFEGSLDAYKPTIYNV